MLERFSIPHNFAINEGILREGHQARHPDPRRDRQGVVFKRTEQLMIADMLNRFGADLVEIGAPVDSPYAMETAHQLIEQTNSTNSRVAIHGRCAQVDLDAMIEASTNAKDPVYNLYIGTSAENRNGNGNRSLDKTIHVAKTAISYLRERAPKNATIRFSGEDAFRTSREDLLQVVEHVYRDVDRIGLADTTGMKYPWEIYDTVHAVKQLVGEKEIEVHFHSDRGLATANYLYALMAGANVLDTTVLGIGERTGPPPLSETMAALTNEHTQQALSTRYQLELLPHIDNTVAGILGVPVPHSSPLTAPGAYTQAAGVHYNAHRNDHSAYSGFDPGTFGREHDFIVASAVVGKAAIFDFAEQNGSPVSMDIAQSIASMVREQARMYGGITEDEVLEIIRSHQ